jgi:hypothetical protein
LLEIEFGVARGKVWRPEIAARGAKRLPRETQNSFEGNKNPAKTHIFLGAKIIPVVRFSGGL